MLDQEDYSYRRVGASSTDHHRNRVLIHIVGGLLIILAVAVGLYCMISWTSDKREEEVITRRLTYVDADAIIPPPESWLLNMPHFEYLINSPSVCRTANDQPANLYFLALIHSRAQHFRQRQVIRQTWASARRSHENGQEELIRPVFLLGLAQQDDTEPGKLDVQALVEAEHFKYGDIVQGPFVDDYHNLTLKNLMGLKWAVRHCDSARFILKSDDDAFVDVDQLRHFIHRTFDDETIIGQQQLDNTFICNVQENARVQRAGKWAVSPQEYASQTYPAFCSGLAYVLRPRLASRLLAASRAGLVRPALWIDDVYVTGLLARAVRAHHFYLNLRYSNQQRQTETEWSATNSTLLPYIVTELDTSRPDWRQMAERMWNKTLHQ